MCLRDVSLNCRFFLCSANIQLIHFHETLKCLQNYLQMDRVKQICVFEHSVMTNFNCTCPAIQRGQGSGFPSEVSSWLTACMSEQRRFWRDCADAQARLNLRCSHTRQVPNSLGAAQMFFLLYEFVRITVGWLTGPDIKVFFIKMENGAPVGWFFFNKVNGPNVLFLTSENEISGIIYSLFRGR